MKIETFLCNNEWRIGSGMMDVGEANGYCALPSDHPCYGMGYDSIHQNYDIDVHGGLTYSNWGHECGIGEMPEYLKTKDYWVIGFDTCHWGDTLGTWPRERVRKHTEELAFRMYEIWLLQERQKSRLSDKSD